MTDAERIERIERLNAVLSGSGAVVEGPFTVWAWECEFKDEHLEQLADWADLRMLSATGTQLTDRSLSSICGFRRLTDLSIGASRITSRGIQKSELPTSLQNLSLTGIRIHDDAVGSIMRCSDLTVLGVDRCGLSAQAVKRFVQLPALQILQALGADTNPEFSQHLSEAHPDVLMKFRDGLWKNGKLVRRAFPE